jgi:hypothetical protein
MAVVVPALQLRDTCGRKIFAQEASNITIRVNCNVLVLF